MGDRLKSIRINDSWNLVHSKKFADGTMDVMGRNFPNLERFDYELATF
jgi:hypothetical protein